VDGLASHAFPQPPPSAASSSELFHGPGFWILVIVSFSLLSLCMHISQPLPTYFPPSLPLLPSLLQQSRLRQYQVVGRHVPTEAHPTPTVFRMKIFAPNEVVAKSRFWYFLHQMHKMKKTTGEILDINELVERNSRIVKNYAIWIKYDSRSGTHNMYREYRDLTLTGAVDQLYSEMAGRHRARFRSIQIIRTGVVAAKDTKRAHTMQYHVRYEHSWLFVLGWRREGWRGCFCCLVSYYLYICMCGVLLSSPHLSCPLTSISNHIYSPTPSLPFSNPNRTPRSSFRCPTASSDRPPRACVASTRPCDPTPTTTREPLLLPPPPPLPGDEFLVERGERSAAASMGG